MSLTVEKKEKSVRLILLSFCNKNKIFHCYWNNKKRVKGAKYIMKPQSISSRPIDRRQIFVPKDKLNAENRGNCVNSRVNLDNRLFEPKF